MVKVPVERKRKSCTTKSRMISPFPHCNNIQCISKNFELPTIVLCDLMYRCRLHA